MLPWTCSENEPHYDLVVPISFSARCLIMIGQAPGMVVCLIAGTIVIQCTLVTFDMRTIIITIVYKINLGYLEKRQPMLAQYSASR